MAAGRKTSASARLDNGGDAAVEATGRTARHKHGAPVPLDDAASDESDVGGAPVKDARGFHRLQDLAPVPARGNAQGYAALTDDERAAA